MAVYLVIASFVVLGDGLAETATITQLDGANVCKRVEE